MTEFCWIAYAVSNTPDDVEKNAAGRHFYTRIVWTPPPYPRVSALDSSFQEWDVVF